MPANTGSYKLVREWINKNGKMPDGRPMPKLKMARLFYNENPLLFSSPESVRVAINKITGKSGTGSGSRLADKSLFEKEARPYNPYNLPQSDETEYEPCHIKGRRILGLFDIHCPYHNIPAISAAITHGKQLEPDTILLCGDSIDAHQLSRFVRDPKKRNFAAELDTFRRLIDAIRNEFPDASIVFKEGNHEERYNHFLYQKAGELYGIEEFALENIIRSRIGEIEYIADKRILKAGDLNIIHGHEFPGGTFSPVNIARGLFLRAKVSCMQGHNHQSSEHTETDMNGRIITTWSVGCLSELHPEYMRLNKWNHGFAFIEVDDDGSFQVHNKRIHKGEVL